MDVWSAAMMGSLAGILGTGAGGFLCFAVRHPSRRLLGTLLHFTGGLMLSVVCFELLPQAFLAYSVGVGLVGLFAGVAFVVVLDGLVEGRVADNGFLRAGILMSVGIAVHNFPEGLAIGSGYASSPALGAGVCLLIAMHDMPEGMAMGIPLREGGMGMVKVFLLCMLSGVPTGLGALAGYALGSASDLLICLSMGVAGGAMLYLTCSSLLPQAGRLHRGRSGGVALCVGVALGIVVTFYLGG